MNDLFGIDLSKLDHLSGTSIIPGRVAHIDGDFIAYYCTKNEGDPWGECTETAKYLINSLRRKARSEKACTHVTPNTSNKGGRHDLALQKPYQSNRLAMNKPSRLENMRKYITETTDTSYGIAWEDQEADDGLCQANWTAIQNGTSDLSVIISKDKDLWQCQGWHMDFKGRTYFVDDSFGSLSFSGGGLTGTGEKWFWAQLLMGDSADTIQGLPFVILNNKIKKCGPSLTYTLLKDVHTAKEALVLCTYLYASASTFKPFICYRTQEIVSFAEAMASEASMLWIRRNRTAYDVNAYFQQIQEK